ncbi:MAG: IS1634 family transposase [Candidatus Dormibacteraeota bacterium]|uniref:IS1634 family transposase n=1 Tax=Candidatus Aeolococcus gillhamiae TaxID=3127015 RepID=A0A934JWT8_9BACT|nr:IS1634 family transposase [Candidatus Dormibacteraeota bacterium]
MYLRETRRTNKDGRVVRYLQLAHNERHPKSGAATARIIHNFGRTDQVDRAGLERLIGSISRVLDPTAAMTSSAGEDVDVLDTRNLGGAWVLDQLWRRLRIDASMRQLLDGRRLDPRVERVLFALVANRALDPLSKLATTQWVGERVAISGLDAVDEDTCYRAMDWLLEIEDELAQAVYWAVADLLDLEVDLLFFDTTSTYFESDGDDVSAEDGERTIGFRTFGHSKDSRADLPQVVIGMAVTRTGIPIRVWTWPGNTNDSALIREVRDDLRAWKLSRVVWVADRGFTSAENRRYLQRAGGHYILGEKLRGESAEAAAALARPGRFHTVAANLRVKEVVIDDGTMRDRFVICHNPEQAERDRAVRQALVRQLELVIADTDALAADKREEAACRLHAKPALRKWLRITAGGRLRIDQAKVRAEERFDGKFLLRTSDPTLSAEDVALGYKQLLEVERGWRDMKSTLDLRPVFHRKEERIRSHVLLCWLALLLIRIAENATQDTWRNLRNELDRMHRVTLATSHGQVTQRTLTNARQGAILAALDLPEPPRYFEFTLPAS